MIHRVARSIFASADPKQGIYRRWFANISRDAVCAVGFEPNPQHWRSAPGRRSLAALERRLAGEGRRVRLFKAAIAADNANSAARFWSDRAAKHDYWGSSLVRWSAAKVGAQDALHHALGPAPGGGLELLHP